MKNFFDVSHLPSSAEQTEIVLDRGGVRVERIVSFGHPTPEGEWYDQLQAEWVILVRGEAVLRYRDGSVKRLSQGDTLLIEARVVHRVESVSQDAVWLAVFV